MKNVRNAIAVADQAAREHKAELKTTRSALQNGESSGRPRPFDPEAFKQRMLSAWG